MDIDIMKIATKFADTQKSTYGDAMRNLLRNGTDNLWAVFELGVMAGICHAVNNHEAIVGELYDPGEGE